MNPLTISSLDLLFAWLERETGHRYEPLNDSSGICATDGKRVLDVRIACLYDADADPEWKRRCDAVSRQLGKLTALPLTLWIPPEADLPHGDRSEFLHRVVDAGSMLESGQRGQVDFPVTLTLTKSSTDASYVHVLGGLAPHWAKLTGRAYGQYVLDATPIHRLPEPQSRVADLLEWVALLGNGMKAGASSDIKAEDSWTIRRSTARHEPVLLGAPPAVDPTNGTSVRRFLRAAVKSAAGDRSDGDAARVLLLLGDFRRMDEENATIALRSLDPSMTDSFDLICLQADGDCRSLLGPNTDRI